MLQNAPGRVRFLRYLSIRVLIQPACKTSQSMVFILAVGSFSSSLLLSSKETELERVNDLLTVAQDVFCMHHVPPTPKTHVLPLTLLPLRSQQLCVATFLVSSLRKS